MKRALLCLVLLACGGRSETIAPPATSVEPCDAGDVDAGDVDCFVESCSSLACSELYASATSGNPTDMYCWLRLTGKAPAAACEFLYGPTDAGGYGRLDANARCTP